MRREQELTKVEIVLEWLGGAALMLMLFVAVVLMFLTSCTPKW